MGNKKTKTAPHDGDRIYRKNYTYYEPIGHTIIKLIRSMYTWIVGSYLTREAMETATSLNIT